MLASSHTVSVTIVAEGSNSLPAQKLAPCAPPPPRLHIQNPAPFDLSFETHRRGSSSAPVAFLFHRQVHNLSGRLHHFGQHRVQRADERLNQVHPHRELSSAAPTVAVTPSSFST